MAIDYVRGGSSRCPSLIVGGLVIVCIFLACSWWSLTSQNFELISQLSVFEEQLAIAGTKVDKCLNSKESLELKIKNLESSAAQARAKLVQLQSSDDDVRGTLTKSEDELEKAKQKITTLESSLTFKNTELDSLKSLGEARNKTLEALRTEKKNLNAKLDENEVKISQLREEITNLQKRNVDRVAAFVHNKAAAPVDAQDGIAIAGSHAAQETQDENNAAEIKNDAPEVAAPVLPETDFREEAMAPSKANDRF